MFLKIRHILPILSALALAIPSRAEVKWLDGIHDFGAFDEDDGKVTCSFRFVNTSAQPVSVVSARPSCGCTVPAFPRRAIQPGDTASIDVTFNPTGRPGRFEKNVKVQLSDDSPAVTLRVKGVVIGNSNTLRSRYPVDAPPLKIRTRVLPFGEVTALKSKAVFFEVYNASPDSVTPRWVDLPSYLRASTVSPTVPPGEQASYALTLVPEKTGTFDLLLDSITFEPAPGAEPIVLDIVATIVEDFSHLTDAQRRDAPVVRLGTSTIDLGELSRQATASGSFTITNEGKNPLKIRRIYSADPGVTVDYSGKDLKKGKSAKVTITVDPARLPAEILDARIAVITNDPYNPRQIVRLIGQISDQ